MHPHSEHTAALTAAAFCVRTLGLMPNQLLPIQAPRVETLTVSSAHHRHTSLPVVCIPLPLRHVTEASSARWVTVLRQPYTGVMGKGKPWALSAQGHDRDLCHAVLCGGGKMPFTRDLWSEGSLNDGCPMMVTHWHCIVQSQSQRIGVQSCQPQGSVCEG